MEPSPSKKSRLEKSHSVLCDEHKDIDDNDGVSPSRDEELEEGEVPSSSSSSTDGLRNKELEEGDVPSSSSSSTDGLRKKELEDGEVPSSNISSTDGLMIQKACGSDESPTQDIEKLFDQYFMLTDKKFNTLFGKEFRPSQYHQWGILTKIKENSNTLRRVTNVSIENLRNCKDTFMNILEELKLEYNVVPLKTLKGKDFQYIFAIDVKSTPKYTFCGYGSTEDLALEAAAKKGLTFFSASCQ